MFEPKATAPHLDSTDHFRSAPNSGHPQSPSARFKGANRGLVYPTIACLFDQFIGAGKQRDWAGQAQAIPIFFGGADLSGCLTLDPTKYNLRSVGQ